MNLKQLLTNINPFKKKEVVEEAKVEQPESPIENLPAEIPSKKIRVKEKNERFTHEQQMFIAECIGRQMNSVEITHDFEEEFELKLQNPTQTIQGFKKSVVWIPVIEKARKEFESERQSVAGYYKRVRLERIERASKLALKNKNVKEIVMAAEQQRKETEKHEFNQFNILNVQYNSMTDEELAEREKFLLSKLKIAKEIKNGNGRVQIEAGKSGDDKGE